MIVRSFAIVAAAMTASCTTATAEPDSVRPARLVQDPGGQFRDFVRTHLFDTIGDDYIADPGELARNGRMIAKDRGRGIVTGQPKLVPDVTFRLELVSIDGAEHCHLVADQDGVPPLRLPDTSDCVPLDR
ncbi:hypothetical protein [uncultured Algimonas sp.]|uniref:hypothetical protein n=1 Tax=uncultured Algimonas sp. TaxID=1547920 RepID=UPI0026259FDB|nr:hypothetical protein [uncultured Algimonas sp.]